MPHGLHAFRIHEFRIRQHGVDSWLMARHAPEFTLLVDGSCSFCGKMPRETRGFVGSSITEARICDACLGLCCAVLAEQVGVRSSSPLSSGAAVPEGLLAEIMATLATQGPPAMPPLNPLYWCDFCHARRPEDVPAFVTGPRVFICNGCVADAVAVVKRQSSAQG